MTLAKALSLLLISILLLPLLAACGPTRHEAWNSYYYGTMRHSSSVYGRYPQDNDDTYVIPQGSWMDDQTPQGMKW